MSLENNTYAKFFLQQKKEAVVELLQHYNRYDYHVTQIKISELSTLLMLEYRNGWKNVYQSLTCIITTVEDGSQVIVYESKSTTSLSNLLCVKKEVALLIEYFTNNKMMVTYLDA